MKVNYGLWKALGLIIGLGRLAVGCCIGGCASPEPRPAPPEMAGSDAACKYYACRGCVRARDYDWACVGHEEFTAAFVCVGAEPDLCKANPYQSECCFPNPEEP